MSTLGFGLRTDLPKVSHSTALDIYIIVCFGFVFAALVEYAVINFAHIIYIRKTVGVAFLPFQLFIFLSHILLLRTLTCANIPLDSQAISILSVAKTLAACLTTRSLYFISKCNQMLSCFCLFAHNIVTVCNAHAGQVAAKSSFATHRTSRLYLFKVAQLMYELYAMSGILMAAQ